MLSLHSSLRAVPKRAHKRCMRPKFGRPVLSSDAVSDHLSSPPGSIEELRFRSVGFSRDDATAPYGGGRETVSASRGGLGQP
jgi:hypothetical protein